jgi:hypothetical protein
MGFWQGTTPSMPSSSVATNVLNARGTA